MKQGYWTVLASCWVLCSGFALAEPGMVVHRGANHLAPENTFAAAQKCIDLGVEYIEVDVQMSRDGVFYIMHDLTVDRTTNGTGLLTLLNSAQIDALDAGSWYGPEFAGEHVPRLDDFLRWVKGKAHVYFDVKAVDLDRFIALIRETGFDKDSFFWFASPSHALRFHEKAPDLALKVNAHNLSQLMEARSVYNARYIETSVGNVTPELVNACRQMGIKIVACPSAETEDAFRCVLATQADFINLNRPELYTALRESSAQLKTARVNP